MYQLITVVRVKTPEYRDMAFSAMTIWVSSESVEAVSRKEMQGRKLNSVPAIPAPLFSFLSANCNLNFAHTLGLL